MSKTKTNPNPMSPEMASGLLGGALGIGGEIISNQLNMGNQQSLQNSAIRGQMFLADKQLSNQMALFNAT